MLELLSGFVTELRAAGLPVSLTEHLDAEGELYLRATDAAITVLIGALELDVESAQIAAELRLNELVRRGLLTAAIDAGLDAVTIQADLTVGAEAARLFTTFYAGSPAFADEARRLDGRPSRRGGGR